MCKTHNQINSQPQWFFTTIAMAMLYFCALLQMLILIWPSVGSTDTPALAAKLDKFKACLTRCGVDVTRDLVHRNSSVSMYSELNRQWNHCCGVPATPAAYLEPRKESDVQAAVLCARNTSVRIVPKGGGHSFLKYSYGDADSVIIDLRHFDNVHVDASMRIATVGAGLLLGPLNHALWKAGKWAIPTGDCQSVGISGLLLGGGHSDYGRLYGMALDTVKEMRIVSAGGELLTVNNATNPDLFWALRGGGTGSYGIVTQFKMDVHREPAAVIYGKLVYNVSEFKAVFKTWEDLASDGLTGAIPNSIHSYIKARRGATFSMHVHVIDILQDGDTKQMLERQKKLEAVLRRFPDSSTTRSVCTLSYLEYVCEHAQSTASKDGRRIIQPEDLANVTRSAPDGLHATIHIKSFYVPAERLTDSAAFEKLDALVQTTPEGTGFYAQMLGGAINQPDPGATSFVHRRDMYLLQFGYVGSQPETKLEPWKVPQDVLDWMTNFWRVSQGYTGHKTSYQNYVDADLEAAGAEEYMERYYGGNAGRLMAIKAAVDPDNVFHHRQSIPSKTF